MKIYRIKDKNDLVSVNVLFPLGMSDDGLEHGMAHLIEHLFFYGHSFLSFDEIMYFFESNGGVINASIDYCKTLIYFRIHKEFVTEGLMIVLDCIKNFNIKESDLQCELRIIEQELREETTSKYMIDMTLRKLYKGVPLKMIGNFTKDKVINFYKRNYNGNNIKLLIYGNYLEDLSFVEETFVYQTNLHSQKLETVNVSENHSSINFASIVAEINHPFPELCLRVWKSFLATGSTSVIYNYLIHEMSFTYNLQFYKNTEIGNSSMIISFLLTKSLDEIQVRENIIKRIDFNLLDEDEIKKTKMKTILELRLLYENKGRFAKFILENMNNILQILRVDVGDCNYFEIEAEKIEKSLIDYIDTEFVSDCLESSVNTKKLDVIVFVKTRGSNSIN